MIFDDGVHLDLIKFLDCVSHTEGLVEFFTRATLTDRFMKRASNDLKIDVGYF